MNVPKLWFANIYSILNLFSYCSHSNKFVISMSLYSPSDPVPNNPFSIGR